MVMVGKLVALAMSLPFFPAFMLYLARGQVNNRGRKGVSESGPSNSEDRPKET